MTTEKELRKGFLGVLDRLIALVDGVKGIAMICAALSLGGASGTLLAKDTDTARKVESLSKEVDSLKRNDSVSSVRLDSMQSNVEEVRKEQQRSRAEQRAIAGALMDALPAFKRSIQERGQANAEARRKQAETDHLLENFTGESIP